MKKLLYILICAIVFMMSGCENSNQSTKEGAKTKVVSNTEGANDVSKKMMWYQ